MIIIHKAVINVAKTKSDFAWNFLMKTGAIPVSKILVKMLHFAVHLTLKKAEDIGS